MSTSWVCRSVLSVISCMAISYDRCGRAAQSIVELDALRADADRFIAELDEEAYLHYAGHKETYDLVPIFERHAELTKLETAQALGATVNGGRNVRELWRFACEGYMGNFVREEVGGVAELEAKLKATVGGEEIAYRTCGRDHERGGPRRARTARARPQRARPRST